LSVPPTVAGGLIIIEIEEPSPVPVPTFMRSIFF